MALQYVLYPKYANDGSAMGEARGLMVRVGLLSTITIVPLWITCGYGSRLLRQRSTRR
jgi:hypothetical protein